MKNWLLSILLFSCLLLLLLSLFVSTKIFCFVFKKNKIFLWSFTFISIAKERKLRKFTWVESPKNFPFYKKRSGFCFKQWVIV